MKIIDDLINNGNSMVGEWDDNDYLLYALFGLAVIFLYLLYRWFIK